MVDVTYSEPKTLDSMTSYTWQQKRGSPDGTMEKESTSIQGQGSHKETAKIFYLLTNKTSL